MIVQTNDSAAPGIYSPDEHIPSAKLNGHKHAYTNGHLPTPKPVATPLLDIFLHTHSALQALLDPASAPQITLDGSSLNIAQVVAAARYLTSVELTSDADVREKVDRGDRKIRAMLDEGKSVYGVSTGYGGSADTRTSEHLALGKSLLQHQHAGVLSLARPSAPTPLPLLDPLTSTSMPESWVRAAILIRTNSLVRGHSGVQWSTAERMAGLLNANVVPVVPLRGSISASGDLQPLSYVAGTLMGNPGIRAYCTPSPTSGRVILPAPEALKAANLTTHTFTAKDHLGILNGTAFSAAVASLALFDASHHLLLSQLLTAMATEALLGARASHHPFIHNTARPHAGQVEVAANVWRLLEGSGMAHVEVEEKEVAIEEDEGRLRQDRYALRTSPQWIGPHVEEMVQAWGVVTQECNSTTDNPLLDPDTGRVYHGGNFQALSVTLTMEKTRLTIAHLGKLLFSQCTEILNPMMNRGLPPNAAGSDPSINYHCKGLDIACAAYVSELGWLANPVSTHVQSAEMHNQAVNSLALISARQTLQALDVLSILSASYLYVLCQALDLRAQQLEFFTLMREHLTSALAAHFPALSSPADTQVLFRVLEDKWESTSSMDAAPRMSALSSSLTGPVVDLLISRNLSSSVPALPAFRTFLSSTLLSSLLSLRASYLSPTANSAPASPYLAPSTRKVYEYVRVELGVRHHGVDNWKHFEDGFEGGTIGQSVSRIYEAIRDGGMREVVVGVFRNLE